jgi:signal transduction histidine kinase
VDGEEPLVIEADTRQALPDLRLQELIEANLAIVGELSLDALLGRVVEAAREIVGADYAALAVLADDGTLERFIHRGVDPATDGAIGEAPKGPGLLGGLLDAPEPIRLACVSDDPRSSDVPLGHPPISSFLGVPVGSATSVYGNLYVTKPIGQPSFSPDDEGRLVALAATAGIAIENARLYAQAQRRQEWLEASAEISHRLLMPDGDGDSVLDDIADCVRRLVPADSVDLVLPAPDAPGVLEIVVTSGSGSQELHGLRYPSEGSIAGQAMQTERGFVVEDAQTRLRGYADRRSGLRATNIMALALKGQGAARGALVVSRINHTPFTDTDLEMAEGFTAQAALALELADARNARHRLRLLDDRGQIARSLHDQVVHKLFTASLSIQGTASLEVRPGVRDRLLGAVETVDDSIRRIRTSIFALQDAGGRRSSLRTRLSAVLAELEPVLPFVPALHFEGMLDPLVDEAVAVEIEAVLREALTNVGKHAQASRASVVLETNERLLCLTIADNGIGLGPSRRRSGLANLRQRAEQLGGYLELDRATDGGLLMRWTIPLE